MSTTQKTATVGATLADARQRLAAHSESPALDAQLLLSHVSGLDRVQLLAHPERILGAKELEAWQRALARLEDGLALPYLLGEWEFCALPLRVTPAVLIPRPETEMLVEAALDWLRAHPDRRRVVDVGTGSAAIAVVLATGVPDVRVTAVDISEEALTVAASNAQRNGVQERIELVHGDLLADLSGPFDVICANLPYIPTRRLAELDVARREPLLALDGGPDGLDLIRRLLEQAPRRLAPGGLLLAEVDDSHEEQAAALARSHFPLADTEVRPDLAGKVRLLTVRT